MGKFKTAPLRALPSEADVARFAAGAATRTVDPVEQGGALVPRTAAVIPVLPSVPVLPPVTAPVEHGESPAQRHLDPAAKPTSGINLRLNDYELDLIRRVAAADDRSLQKTIKRLLIPALESELANLH